MACNDGSRCVYVPTRATIILSTPSPNHIYLPLAHHSSSHHPSYISTPRPPLFIPPPFVYIYPSPTTSSHHPSYISTPRPPLFIPPPFVYIYPSPTTLHPTTFRIYLPLAHHSSSHHLSSISTLYPHHRYHRYQRTNKKTLFYRGLSRKPQ